MKPLLSEVNETLISDQFKGYVEAGLIKAIVLEDGTVSLMSQGIVLTNPIPVERK